MEKPKSSNTGGVGFCGSLGIAFIVLKLLDVIEWSWIWVTSPIWIFMAVVIIEVALIASTTKAESKQDTRDLIISDQDLERIKLIIEEASRSK